MNDIFAKRPDDREDAFELGARLSPGKLITLLPVGLAREPELNILISEGRRSESAEMRGERR